MSPAGNPQTAICVVIPAHDEEVVLGRCLNALLSGSEPGEFDVTVVANGCRDETASVARTADVRVIETPVASKVHALRLGDRACRSFPRLYLDADVELTGDAVRALASALAETGVLACAPTPQYELTGAGPVAARFHRTYDLLRSRHRGLSGAGAYMVGRAAHSRIFPLPDVVSDDGWVHRSFAPDERLVVAEARCVVRPPRTVAAEMRRRHRTRLANKELTRLGKRPSGDGMTLPDLLRLVDEGRIGVIDCLSFLAVLMLERTLTVIRDIRGDDEVWSADPTSRVLPRTS